MFPQARVSECRLEAMSLPAVGVVAGFIPTISAGWAPKPEAGQFGPPRSH